MRNAIWDTFGKGYLLCALYTILADVFAIGFTTYLIELINFIKNPNGTAGEGFYKLLVFSFLMIVSLLLKNAQIWQG